MLWDRISLARPPALPFCSGGGLALRTSPLAKASPPCPAVESRNPRPDRVCKCEVQILVLHPSIPLAVRVPCFWKSWGLGHRYACRFSERATGF